MASVAGEAEPSSPREAAGDYPPPAQVRIAGFNRPSSILLAEAFSIQRELIQQVEAVGTSVPYHSDPGWGR